MGKKEREKASKNQTIATSFKDNPCVCISIKMILQ